MIKHKKAVTIDFVEGSRALPFIWVKLEGMDSPKLAMIDTGSEITLLNKSIADSVADTAKMITSSVDKNVVIDGVGGTKKHKEASQFASFFEITTSEGKTMNIVIDGTVVDLTPTINALHKACDKAETIMIIGSDTFKKLKAKVDFKKRQLILYDLFCDKQPEEGAAR